MPRIRTIKPEFWTDEKVMAVSIPSRLLFIGLWNWADDNGVIENKKMQIKARIYPCDNIDIGILIDELVKIGLLKQYEANSGGYLLVSNLWKHQIIDKPRKSNLPLPGNQPISNSVNGNQLKSIEIISLKEGKGREGKERNKRGTSVPFAPPSLEEIQAYIQEKGYQVNPEGWLSHYEANGWMVGKNRMHDWKAAVRTWQHNGYGQGNGRRPSPNLTVGQHEAPPDPPTKEERLDFLRSRLEDNERQLPRLQARQDKEGKRLVVQVTSAIDNIKAEIAAMETL